MTATDGNDGDFRAHRQLTLATVAAVLPNDLFRLRLEDGSERTAHVGGELRRAVPRLLPGDRVRIELSAIDPSKARISARAGQLAARPRAPATNASDSNSESLS